jgi:hypothetical protein
MCPHLLFFINHRIGIEKNIRSRLVWVQAYVGDQLSLMEDCFHVGVFVGISTT